MASSSSSTTHTWRYDLFLSFLGGDVHKTFLSQLRKHLEDNGISIFDDQLIKRGDTIAPKLTQAIKESRISIVVLSKHYASSGWCLDELLDILKCNEEMGKIVITVFFGVDPSDVRKQTGIFGKAFNKRCRGETEEKRGMWSQSLNALGNIPGHHLQNWDKESDMIEKITEDVLNKLNAAKEPSFRARVIRRLGQVQRAITEPSFRTNKRWYSTRMAFLVVINLLLEVVSAVADQLSSIRKPYFARISLVTAILSVILSILELTIKIRVHKARFRCKWPMPWFYYPSRNYNRIFGNFTDTVILFCAVGQLIVSTISCIFIERGQDGPIKVSVWPLFFAIGMAGSKFMEKPLNSKEN